jgi:hypothetical protein
MALNDHNVLLEDGSACLLSDLFREGPIALVFLRHLGCVFCRYQVAQLRSEKDLPIYFVCMESCDEAAKFKKRMRSPHRFICDPERKLYEAFGVGRGTTGQIFSLKTLAVGVKAAFSGSFQGRPTADPMQLGAAIVLDRGGEIMWSHYAADAADIVSASDLRANLLRFGKEEAALGREDAPSPVE